MRSTSEITVGEDRYAVTHYSATVAGELFIELTKKIGPVLSALVTRGQDEKVSLEMVADLIQRAVPNFERGEFTRLAREILSGTLAFLDNGKNMPVTELYDLHFQGRLTHLYKVLAAVLKFQYSDFLKEPAGNISEPKAGAAQGRIKAL